MKKIVLLVLAVCLAASLLGGCGGRNTSIGQNQSAGSVTPAQSESPAGKKTMVIGDTTFNSENWEETVDPHRTYNGWRRRDPGALHRHHGAGTLAGKVLGK